MNAPAPDLKAINAAAPIMLAALKAFAKPYEKIDGAFLAEIAEGVPGTVTTVGGAGVVNSHIANAVIAARTARASGTPSNLWSKLMHIKDHVDGTVSAQGDIVFWKLPKGWTPKTNDEITPRAGKLVIAEGEATGHHHGIDVLERPSARGVPLSSGVDKLIDDALANRIAVPTARLFRDPDLANRLVREGPLTRSDLCVGFLVVEGAPHTVTHDEHDGIRLPEGAYYCGRQVESAGAEERRVAD